MIDLSVIVASYETRGRLLDCIESVLSAARALREAEVEVIVVDNGSRDGSALAISERHPGVRLLARLRNTGFAAAMNAGIRAARGRHLLLLNSDVEVKAALLGGALRLLDGDGSISLLAPALRHGDGRLQRSLHAPPDWHSECLPLPSRWRAEERRRVAAARPADVCDVEAVRGAALFLPATVAEKVGVLDERFFFFLEETEFCTRIRRAGGRVVFAPGLEARHHLGESSKRRAPLETRIEYHRSLYRFLRREHGPGLAGVARGVRCVRALLTCTLNLPAAALSGRARARCAERFGLALWHLRGCPDAPGLAACLASRPLETDATDPVGAGDRKEAYGMTSTDPRRDSIGALLDRLPASRVLVVGDLMLDEYRSGDVERVSPEAPVPVVEVTRTRCAPGGAGNVALGVRALGAHCRLVATLGTDPEGDRTAGLLAEAGFDAGDVLRSSGPGHAAQAARRGARSAARPPRPGGNGALRRRSARPHRAACT